jgi:hypothetical protein
MQLKKYIDEKKVEGTFRAYPIIDDERRILWPEKYRDVDDVRKLSKRFPDVVWVREFLLKSLSTDGHTLIQPIIIRRFRGDGIETERKRDVPPKQTPLIPQMKKFSISVPYDRAPIYLIMNDDPEYALYFGNVDLDEPMRSGSEKAERILTLADTMVEEMKRKEFES